MIKKSNKAVLLLSGGLDSAVVLSICKKLGYEVNAITFDYNQRHKVELNCAKWQAEYFQCISHRICLLYTSPSPRDATLSRRPSSA